MSLKNDTGPCFYCPDLPEPGNKTDLEGNETHHAGTARRIRVGDSIGLIDGKGIRAAGIVEAVARKKLTVTIKEKTQIEPPALSVYVACAVPKGERFRTMIDMLGQVGVAGILPLVCERSTVKPKPASLERWRRVAIEACKQSRNPYLPEIRAPQGLADALAGIVTEDVLVFADVEGRGVNHIATRKGALHVYIGPEGGFTDNEKQMFRDKGGSPLNLGVNILRVETAAVVAAALVALGAKV